MDPAGVMAAALGAYADAYGFVATATVNGETATVVEGRWVEGSAEFVVRSGAGEVEYVVTSAGQWVRTPDGAWQELEGTPPAGNPLAPFAAPTTLRVLAATGADVQIAAVYPASAFGGGEGPLDVTLTFRSGILAEARYLVVTDGTAAESVTVFALLQDQTPIIAPAA